MHLYYIKTYYCVSPSCSCHPRCRPAKYPKRNDRSSPRHCEAPRKIVTDQPRSYPEAKAKIPELASVKHVLVRASARVNNRVDNSHQLTREHERRMRGFRVPEHTQAFLSSFGPI
jgi:transposase-like protein